MFADSRATPPTNNSIFSYQAIDAYKLLWTLGPRRELHVRHYGAILHHTQVVAVAVDKHLGEVIELWDQFL